MAKSRIDNFERFHPVDRAAWRQWLADNHDKAPGVWVIQFSTKAGQPTITYDELVEEALCFGWIDSLMRKLDDERRIQMVTPRKPRSIWAKTNKARVERLIAQGLMRPAGLAKIEAAQADGSWNTLDAVEALTMPDDLREALATNVDARRHFEAFSPSAQKMILYWIASAKKPETRAKRIAETIRLAAQNIKANQ
jgi:uncharacterized protein YdeI (YjbR/CyaY-like superfamily)